MPDTFVAGCGCEGVPKAACISRRHPAEAPAAPTAPPCLPFLSDASRGGAIMCLLAAPRSMLDKAPPPPCGRQAQQPALLLPALAHRLATCSQAGGCRVGQGGRAEACVAAPLCRRGRHGRRSGGQPARHGLLGPGARVPLVRRLLAAGVPSGGTGPRGCVCRQGTTQGGGLAAALLAAPLWRDERALASFGGRAGSCHLWRTSGPFPPAPLWGSVDGRIWEQGPGRQGPGASVPAPQRPASEAAPRRLRCGVRRLDGSPPRGPAARASLLQCGLARRARRSAHVRGAGAGRRHG